MADYLSKSDFKAARECPTKLFYREPPSRGAGASRDRSALPGLRISLHRNRRRPANVCFDPPADSLERYHENTTITNATRSGLNRRTRI
jgi:hypothetical protein